MAIPHLLVIQPDHSTIKLHRGNGEYRQRPTLITVFQPVAYGITPSEVISYEELTPYNSKTQSLTWLLIGMSLGVLACVYGPLNQAAVALVIFVFALASLIFSRHGTARQSAYRLGMKNGSQVIVAIPNEHRSTLPQTFPEATEVLRPPQPADELRPNEMEHVDRIRYGFIVAASSAAILVLSQKRLDSEIHFADDLGAMLSMALTLLLIGMIAVAAGKLTVLERRQKTEKEKIINRE